MSTSCQIMQASHGFWLQKADCPGVIGKRSFNGGILWGTNFHLAPPSKTVDGLVCVPIDIESIEAAFTFDGAAQTAIADATITYTVGPTDGNPIFDLRQNITSAWVDGTVFPIAQLAHHDFGTGAFTNLRVIEDVQTACSARHFVVTFNIPGYLSTQLHYPDDFIPCVAAKADFELAPGGTRIVKAKWPRALIPPEGTHTCVLASVITKSNHPIAGRHVWEDNNLAQKNLTVVDLEADDDFFVIPIVIRNFRLRFDPRFDLEVWRPRSADGLKISLIHRSKDFFKTSKAKVDRFIPEFAPTKLKHKATQLDCGGVPDKSPSAFISRRLSSANPEGLLRRFPNAWVAAFDNGEVAKLAVNIPQSTQNVVGLKIAVTEKFKSKKPVKLHFVQRNVKTKQIVGGVAVQVNRSKK